MTDHTERFARGVMVVLLSLCVVMLGAIIVKAIVENLIVSGLFVGVVIVLAIVSYVVGYLITDFGDDARRWIGDE